MNIPTSPFLLSLPQNSEAFMCFLVLTTHQVGHEMALLLSFWFFSVHCPWPDFPRPLELPLAAALSSAHREQLRGGGRIVGLALRHCGVLVEPVRRSSGEILPEAPGQTSC